MGSRVFRKREEKLGYKLKGDVKSSRIFYLSLLSHARKYLYVIENNIIE